MSSWLILLCVFAVGLSASYLPIVRPVYNNNPINGHDDIYDVNYQPLPSSPDNYYDMDRNGYPVNNNMQSLHLRVVSPPRVIPLPPSRYNPFHPHEPFQNGKRAIMDMNGLHGQRRTVIRTQ